jgi:DNA-binding YbaB/EbfC family protein
MGTGFSKKKKQAKAFQSQFAQLQSSLKEKEFIGTAGNGLVTITVSGDGELKQIKIKPECVDPEDIEGLEDLIKAAFKDASDRMAAEQPSIPGLPSGLPDLKSFGF